MSYRCTHYPIGSAKRNAKYAVRRMAPKFTSEFTKARGIAIAAAMTISAMIWTAAAQAAECPRKGALGISRFLRVDTATFPRFGLKSFPQSLPARPRGGAHFRRRTVARHDAQSAGRAGARMRARDILRDRQAGLGAPETGAPDCKPRPHRRPPHLVASRRPWMQLRKTRNKGGISGIKAAFMAPL